MVFGKLMCLVLLVRTHTQKNYELRSRSSGGRVPYAVIANNGRAPVVHQLVVRTGLCCNHLGLIWFVYTTGVASEFESSSFVCVVLMVRPFKFGPLGWSF